MRQMNLPKLDIIRLPFDRGVIINGRVYRTGSVDTLPLNIGRVNKLVSEWNFEFKGFGWLDFHAPHPWEEGRPLQEDERDRRLMWDRIFKLIDREKMEDLMLFLLKKRKTWIINNKHRNTEAGNSVHRIPFVHGIILNQKVKFLGDFLTSDKEIKDVSHINEILQRWGLEFARLEPGEFMLDKIRDSRDSRDTEELHSIVPEMGRILGNDYELLEEFFLGLYCRGQVEI